MGILFTILMGFLFTITLGFLFTIVQGIQFTISKTQAPLVNQKVCGFFKRRKTSVKKCVKSPKTLLRNNKLKHLQEVIGPLQFVFARFDISQLPIHDGIIGYTGELRKFHPCKPKYILFLVIFAKRFWV